MVASQNPTTRKQGFGQPWTILGGPESGTISALAMAQEAGGMVFVGTNVGLFRSIQHDPGVASTWERLVRAPVGVLCLALSPNFAEDHRLVAGTNTGIFISTDSGLNWHAAKIPMENSSILTVSFSPNFQSDGILMAGTLEDGVLFSESRGESWANKGFGLLDPTVFSLAFSPSFAKDETVFIGTDTAIYQSYNAGRAWKRLHFPEENAPVLSLALSPDYASDRTLSAGTEQQGLFQSTDRGMNWQKTGCPAACINAVLVAPHGANPAQQVESARLEQYSLLAATESGVYASSGKGEAWKCLAELPGVLCLASRMDPGTGSPLVLAGLVDQGLWSGTGRTDWKHIPLATRSLLGLALSPGFERDGAGFLYGSQDGAWRTLDGGKSWENLESLPSLDVRSLVLSPDYPENQALAVASPDGLFCSLDAGDQWQVLANEPASLLSVSPNGRLLACSFPGAGVRMLDPWDGRPDPSWIQVQGPWDDGGSVAALAVSILRHVYVALLEEMGETLSLWQGKPGQIEKVWSQPVGKNPPPSLWIPPEPEADRPWYAGLGRNVLKFSSRAGGVHSKTSLPPDSPETEKILSLTGIQGQAGSNLYACTGRSLYRSADFKSWARVHAFGDDIAVAVALSGSFARDRTAYALLVGGKLCKGTVR